MLEALWKKVNYISGLLPIGALFGLLVFVANVEVKDLDLWLHLAVGKFITLHHFVPDVDILSCTIQGAPWVNHEWLFQILVYNIFNTWGPDGLLKMQIVVVTLTMLFLLFLGYQKDRQLLLSFILCLVYLVFQQRFTTRPDLFSLLFFTLYIYTLALHIDKKWSTWFLFGIQIVWSNIHGFFFFGPLFVFIGLFSEWLKRKIPLPWEWNESGRLTDTEYRRLKKIFVFVVLACLVNPQGVAGAWYPIGVFFSFSGENKIFFKYIQELQKPIAWDTIFEGGRFVYYKLLILISFVSFIFNRRRIDISALFFWIIFLIFSLCAVRNTPFFAFAAYLVFITNMINVSFNDLIPIRFTAKKFSYLTFSVISLLLLIWILEYCQGISARAYYDFDKYEQKSEFGGISLRSYPQKAADFLVENNVKGNFFNDFNSGAYLIGRCFPNIKVFIDGRTEVYGGEFFKEYQEIWDNGDAVRFEAAVKKYNLTGVFLNSSRQHIPKRILKYLYAHKDWHVVYFGYDGVILLRDLPENKDLIEKFAIDLAQWEPKQLDLLKIGASRVLPFHPYYRAFTLESLDLDEIALKEAKEAIKILPTYAEAYDLIGKVYSKRKEYKKAFENFRISVSYAQGDMKKNHNLALAYADMKEYKYAIKQYETIINRWPNDAQAYFLLAKNYAKNEQYDEALKSLERAHQRNPADVMDILGIGDIIYDQESYTQARAAYTIALKTNRKLAKVYQKIGESYLAEGEIDKAKDELKQALSIDPKSEEIQKSLKHMNSLGTANVLENVAKEKD